MGTDGPRHGLPGDSDNMLERDRSFLGEGMGFTRRKLLASAGMSAGMLSAQERATTSAASRTASSAFPTVSGLTREVAEFITGLQYTAIPENVIELGRKSILDGLGLALCGSAAESGLLS